MKLDLADRDGMANLFKEFRFPHVIHLGAQAGVRYSLIDPFAYVDANFDRLHPPFSKAAVTITVGTYFTRRLRPSTAPTRKCRSRVHDNVDHPFIYTARRRRRTS